MGPRVAPVLVSLVLALAVAVAAARAQDVFSTTTGGGAPLQGGVSVTEPAAPGHTRPTGTQGVEGNPDCPPPRLADGTTPKNWSCTTRGQGVVGNPDCPAPVSADGTTPKNWSCRTGTQGVEGNPNCPPPALPNGLVPRNWSCAGPDMQPDPLSPLRDPTIPVDYRGDPGVPPLMRANAATDEEAAAGAVLTCRRAVVEAIDRPSQAETAEYVCDDQGKALDQPPFQLRVEQTVCILPLKGAVEELKAGKMLLMKAKDSAGAERDWHMTRGNAHLLRASVSVDQSDLCMVENPPQPRAARQRPPAPPADLRAAAKDPCKPVAGLDPRLRGALDANCPKVPKPVAKAEPQPQPQPQPQPKPGPQQALEPKTDVADDDCHVARPPLDVQDMLMDLAHRLDRNADLVQGVAMKGTNRFFQGMNDVVQQQIVVLSQERGKPVSDAAAAAMKYLTNDAKENHNKLLDDTLKAVKDFQKDPTYESGKMVSNYLIGRVSGAVTDRLPGGAKFCAAGSRRATEETLKLKAAIEAAEELEKMGKQAADAAEGAKVCRLRPDPAQEARARAKAQKSQQEQAKRASEREKTRNSRKQAGEQQARAQAERDKAWREAMRQKDAKQGSDVARRQAVEQQAAAAKAVDEERAKLRQAMREQNQQVDTQRQAAMERKKAEASRRPSSPSADEAAQQRKMREAERQHAVEEAKRKAAQRRDQAARPQEENLSPEQRRRAEEREMADQARREQKARAERRAAAGGDVPRQPSDQGDTVRMRPEGGDTVQMRPEGGDTVRIPRESADVPRQPQSDDYAAAAAQMRREQQARSDRLPGDTVRIPREGGYGGGAGAPGPGGGDLKSLTDQPSKVNPFEEEGGCFPAAVAGDLRKKSPGMPYTADDIRPSWSDRSTPPVEVMEILEKRYGGLQFDDHTARRRRAQALGIPTKVASSGQIREELLRGNADSRGIVFAYDKVNGKGHVVRAERDGAQVKYIDEQKNTDGTMWAVAPDWTPGDFDLFFYRTN